MEMRLAYVLCFFCRTLFSGYDGDAEADLASHVSESSSVANADSNIPTGEVCSASMVPEVTLFPISLF
jgi:hypothetical protein